MKRTGPLALSLLLLLGSGCGGALVKLAKQQDWTELDRQARAQKRPPRGKAARAWAQALVELGEPDQARALLLRDFRNGGQEQSLLALAQLEHQLGLLGMAGAHYTRLVNIDLDTLQRAPDPAAICALLRARAQAEAALDEPLAADADMRRLALVCPQAIDDSDRGFMSSLQPQAREQARGQRSIDALAPTPEALALVEARLAEQLELARKRGPRAVRELAEAEDMQVEPDDVALLLAAEFAGALGPGLASSRRLSGWIGDAKLEDVLAAIQTLPAGAREYASLRLAGARPGASDGSQEQTWIVTAMASVGGQGPHEAAKAWRVAASVGDLGGAEFALNTNLRDMIPVVVDDAAAPEAAPVAAHWSRRVPVDRRSFDLLLTLARLLEQREQPVLALELRRAVLVAGHEIGLAQAAGSALEEVRRQLVLGHPWQALAIAEVVPGPLLDEVLPAVVSEIGLARAAGQGGEAGAQADDADRNSVYRSLGDPWFERWDPRLNAAVAALDLGDADRCPQLGRWLDPDASEQLARVGLDPQRSREALEAAFEQLGAPATGVALAAALESDLALSCSAPLINLLHAGPHLLTIETLDERLIHAPELSASTQLQLHAELALAHGQGPRASLLTISAAAQTPAPLELWRRAAVAGSSFGAREYTLEALRQVLAHSDGLDDAAARRELVLILLRDVDADELLRAGDELAMDALREQLRVYVEQAPAQRRWARLDQLLWTLAGEARADALAWERLLEILDGPAVRARHPDAVAALERAAGADDPADPAQDNPELSFLSDTEALCTRTELALGSGDAALGALVGAATTCSPRVRAAALGALVSSREGPAKAQLRGRVLAGPLALETSPEHPGVARAVPALARPGASLRVAFELPLDPLWVVDGGP